MEISVKAEGANAFEMSAETIQSARFSRKRDLESRSIFNDRRTITFEGRIHSANDETLTAANWASVPAQQREAYQSFELTTMAAGNTVRQYLFDSAFVIRYSERFSAQSGVGTFSMTVRELSIPKKQKKPEEFAPIFMYPVVFSTVNSSGQRRVDFESAKDFISGRNFTIVNDGRRYVDMLSMGYRWENSRRTSTGSIVEDRTYYVRHLADIEIRRDGVSHTISNGAYLHNGASYIIAPLQLFTRLDPGSDPHISNNQYVFARGSERVTMERATAEGFSLNNVRASEVQNRLGNTLGFDLAWSNTGRRTVQFLFRAEGNAKGMAAEIPLITVEMMRAFGWQSSNFIDDPITEVARINALLSQYGITDPHSIAFFMATARHETGMGRSGVEQLRADGTAVGANPAQYRGAGALQLTHRPSQENFLKHVGYSEIDINRIRNGAGFPRYISENYFWESATWFWTSREGRPSEGGINFYVEEHGGELCVYLITQFWVNGWPMRVGGQRGDIIPNALAGQIARGEVVWRIEYGILHVSGQQFHAPIGWDTDPITGRLVSYHAAMEIFI